MHTVNRANLATRAARAATNHPSVPNRDSSIPLTSPTITGPVGYEGVRRHGNKRSGKGGSSTGGVNGMWRTVSPTKRDAIVIDHRWDQTVRNPSA